MRDERPTVDGSQEFNAEAVNLSFWQLGAMGLAAPKATMMWLPPTVKLNHGNFAWDQTIYDDVALGSLPAYILSYVVNGTGDYTLTFDNEVLGRPDNEGVPQLEVLDFQFGLADVNLLAPTEATQRGFAEVTLVNPQTFRIHIRRGGIAVDLPYTLAVW